MKKWKFKGWVRNVLRFITILSFIIMLSDCDSSILFVISHLVASVVFVTTISLLEKH